MHAAERTTNSLEVARVREQEGRGRGEEEPVSPRRVESGARRKKKDGWKEGWKRGEALGKRREAVKGSWNRKAWLRWCKCEREREREREEVNVGGKFEEGEGRRRRRRGH